MPDDRQLLPIPAPATNGNGHGSVPAVPDLVTVYPSYTYADNTPEEPTVPLSHYGWILKRHKWRILAFVVVCVASTAVISSRLVPIFESTSTIDIDRQAPAAVIGQDAARIAPNDADQFLATQIKIIQSDSVLRPVTMRLRIPILEAAVPGQTVRSAERAMHAPVAFRNLKVTRPPNTYLLLITYRSPDPDLAADVANAVAESYIQHTYDVRFRATAGLSAFMEKQMEELRAKMERSSAALTQYERT